MKLLVPSDPPDSPWFDAGVHRSLRAPASFLNLTCGPPCQPLFYSPSNRFLLAPSGKYVFSLGWRLLLRTVFCFLSKVPGSFLFHHRLVPGLKPLYLFNKRCFLVDSFSDSFIFCLVFYSIYFKNIWNNFYAHLVFTLVRVLL